MKMKFYAIFDDATAAYMRPFLMQSDGQAMRMFLDECKKSDSPIAAHPEDYSLFRVGSWNDQDAGIEAQNPTCLARAHELLAGENQEND